MVRRNRHVRSELQLALHKSEIERLKSIVSKITDGRQLVITPSDPGAGGPTTPGVEAAAHVLYGSKHSRALRVTDNGGIDIAFEQGQIWVGGTFFSIVAGTLTLTDNATNYVFVNNVGAVADNTTGFPTDSAPLALVTTVAADITALADRRAYLSAGAFGGGAVLGNPLIIGIDDTTHGEAWLYGDGAASTAGGALRMYLAADHDGTFHWWELDVFEDDLRFFSSDNVVVNIMKAAGQLQLPISGSGAGLLLGGDALLYRIAADVLSTPDSLRVGGYLNVGSESAPSDTTAGDLTFIRAFGGAQTISIWQARDVDGGDDTGLLIEAIDTPVGHSFLAGAVIRGRARPEANTAIQTAGLFFNAIHDSGAFDLTNTTGGLVGIQGEALQNVGSSIVARAVGLRAGISAEAGTITEAAALEARLGSAGADAGDIGTEYGLDVVRGSVATGGVATTIGVNIRDIGGGDVITAVGLDIAVPTGAGTNIAFRMTGQALLTTLGSSGGLQIGSTVIYENAANILYIEPDTDNYLVAYRAAIGDMGASDFAGFSHLDKRAITTYALLQQSTGATFVNAASSQALSLRINNSNEVVITAGNCQITDALEIDGPLNHDGSTVGFYGTVPATLQDITGARDDPEAALANLLTALAVIGLITDSTTAS